LAPATGLTSTATAAPGEYLFRVLPVGQRVGQLRAETDIPRAKHDDRQDGGHTGDPRGPERQPPPSLATGRSRDETSNGTLGRTCRGTGLEVGGGRGQHARAQRCGRLNEVDAVGKMGDGPAERGELGVDLGAGGEVILHGQPVGLVQGTQDE
jgi:hypothetical protein